MLKIVYDVKCGFDDCYVFVKDQEYELTLYLDDIRWDEFKAGADDPIPPDAELCEKYKDDVEAFFHDVIDVRECMVGEAAARCRETFFAFARGPQEDRSIPKFCEYENARLVYEPDREEA